MTRSGKQIEEPLGADSGHGTTDPSVSHPHENDDRDTSGFDAVNDIRQTSGASGQEGCVISLMDLPIETRLQIYRFTLYHNFVCRWTHDWDNEEICGCPEGILASRPNETRACISDRTAIIRANKHIYQEARNVLFEVAEFAIGLSERHGLPCLLMDEYSEQPRPHGIFSDVEKKVLRSVHRLVIVCEAQDFFAYSQWSEDALKDLWLISVGFGTRLREVRFHVDINETDPALHQKTTHGWDNFLAGLQSTLPNQATVEFSHDYHWNECTEPRVRDLFSFLGTRLLKRINLAR